jgi:hypothetical protein
LLQKKEEYEENLFFSLDKSDHFQLLGEGGFTLPTHAFAAPMNNTPPRMRTHFFLFLHIDAFDWSHFIYNTCNDILVLPNRLSLNCLITCAPEISFCYNYSIAHIFIMFSCCILCCTLIILSDIDLKTEPEKNIHFYIHVRGTLLRTKNALSRCL